MMFKYKFKILSKCICVIIAAMLQLQQVVLGVALIPSNVPTGPSADKNLQTVSSWVASCRGDAISGDVGVRLGDDTYIMWMIRR